MSFIQVLLGLFLLAGVLLAIKRLRSQLAVRLVFMATAAVLLFLVIRPDISTRVAHIFGVGRGVDFLFYITHAATLLILIFIYSELRAHAARTTELVRALALLQPRPPERAGAIPEPE